LYFTPGKSRVRPPRTITTPCDCKLCPSPGMYAQIVFFVDNKRTLATFLNAEFGFFGERTTTRKHTPLAIGCPLNAGVRNLLLGFFRFF